MEMNNPMTVNIPRNKHIREKIYADNVQGLNKREKYYDFLSDHPTLWDGVDLDQATIDYVNNFFFDYDVNPWKFERYFIQRLRHSVAIYNKLKSIELQDKIFDLTDNETVRHLTTKTTDQLNNEKNSNKTINNTGDTTTTNSNNTKSTGGTTTTTEGTSQDDSTNKTIVDGTTDTIAAQRTLPMNTSGDSNIDSLKDWSYGSSASESKTDDDSTTTTTNTDKSSTEGSTNYTQDLLVNASGNLKVEDNRKQTEELLEKLGQIANGNVDTWETNNNRNQMVVDMVNKIWNYLIAPKAIDYLIGELEGAFYNVY